MTGLRACLHRRPVWQGQLLHDTLHPAKHSKTQQQGQHHSHHPAAMVVQVGVAAAVSGTALSSLGLVTLSGLDTIVSLPSEPLPVPQAAVLMASHWSLRNP